MLFFLSAEQNGFELKNDLAVGRKACGAFNLIMIYDQSAGSFFLLLYLRPTGRELQAGFLRNKYTQIVNVKPRMRVRNTFPECGKSSTRKARERRKYRSRREELQIFVTFII